MFDAVQISGETVRTLSVSTSAANTGQLKPGVYRVWSTVAVSVRIERDTPAPAISTANGYPVGTSEKVDFLVGDEQTIFAIAGGSGTMSYIRIGDL